MIKLFHFGAIIYKIQISHTMSFAINYLVGLKYLDRSMGYVYSTCAFIIPLDSIDTNIALVPVLAASSGYL